MPRPSLKAPLFVLALASACGGITAVGPSSGSDAGPGHDAGTPDAASGDAGCVESPVEGAACTPGVSVACSEGDPCCTGYVWQCSAPTGTWEQELLGCACEMDDGGGFGDSGTGGDSGYSGDSGLYSDSGTGADASDACGGCGLGEVCVITTSGGGPCEMPDDGGACPGGGYAPPGGCCDNSSTSATCVSRPSTCSVSLTCDCVQSLCDCPCQRTEGDDVYCACELP